MTILSRVISRGMAKSGRTYAVTLDLIDKPGQLLGVSKIIAEQGGNVISVHHERNSESADVTGCALRVVMENQKRGTYSIHSSKTVGCRLCDNEINYILYK